MSDAGPVSERVSAAPAPAELIARAESLVPLLRENAVRAEELRRLPDDSVRALDDAGLFLMTRPVRYGGYGTDADTVLNVLAVIASGCPATTWVMSIYTGVGHLAELLSEEALTEIYAHPRSRIAGVFGRVGAVVDRVDGGFRVRDGGRWPFNSGCHHAAWDLLRVMVAEPDGSSTPAFAAVPMSELTICDDWHVMGAAGTGSNSVTCAELFVPEHRVTRLTMDARSLIPPDVALACGVALPLGMARYALEVFRVLARARGIAALGYERMVDAPVVHAAVATAAVNVKMIEAFVQWGLSATAATAGGLDADDDAIIRAGHARCFRLAREAIEALYEVCPSSEIYSTTPIQRLLRDVHVFEHQHQLAPFINNELSGRRLCES
jgi:alkylation response protein AidB-like acyl-CoA dehydrogenase